MPTVGFTGRIGAAPALQAQASLSVERFGGACGIVAGALAFLYAVAFVVLRIDLLSALCLLVNGFLTSAVLTAVYARLRTTDEPLAQWGVVLALAATRRLYQVGLGGLQGAVFFS